MTVHRLDEAIVLVSCRTSRRFGSVHIARPRSMKGLGYCGIRIPSKTDVQRIQVLNVEDPWNIPLEIRVERDLRDLCSRCATTFVDETVDQHAATPYKEIPDLWKHIHSRALRRRRQDVWTKDELDEAERDVSTDPRENRPFGDALTAEEDAVAADDSLERQDLVDRELERDA